MNQINARLASPPRALREVQEWFGALVSQRLTTDNRFPQRTPLGKNSERETERYIIPSPTLKPHERIEIYYQQYWWRLLRILHETFPSVTRLLGYTTFNATIAIPYLVRCPPHHWSIHYTGEKLPHWMQKYYRLHDADFLREVVACDWLMTAASVAPQLPFLDLAAFTAEEPDKLLTIPLKLQPHLHFLSCRGELPALRAELQTHPVEYWKDHALPSVDRTQLHYYIFYQTPTKQIAWKAVTATETQLLRQFQRGISLEGACGWIERQSPTIRAEMTAKLQEWIQQWASRHWITLS